MNFPLKKKDRGLIFGTISVVIVFCGIVIFAQPDSLWKTLVVDVREGELSELACIHRRTLTQMNRIVHDARQDSLAYQEAKHNPDKIQEIFNIRGTTDRIPYHGQGNEGGSDRYVAEVLLPLKFGGRFFEMGAYNGWDSNTWFFENHREWTGVMVEASTSMFNLAKGNRPKSDIHNVAISMQEGFLVDVKGHGGMTTTVCGNREPSAEQIRQHNTRSD